MKSLMMISVKLNGKYKVVINFVLLLGILLIKKKINLLKLNRFFRVLFEYIIISNVYKS